MGMFANLLSKLFGRSTPEPSSTDVPPTTTVESATAPSPTTPAASAVSSLSSTSVAPSTPDLESEGHDARVRYLINRFFTPTYLDAADDLSLTLGAFGRALRSRWVAAKNFHFD